MRAIRIGICVLLAFSVFAHGVVEVWSESLLEIGASILLICWALLAYRDRQVRIEWNPLIWPLLGFLGIGVFQIVFHLTANPFLTRTELLRLAAYFIIFFLTTQVFRERPALVKLAWFLIFLGFSVGLLGIIQHFTSDGTIYWVRRLPQGGDVFGPYVNRNHFAGFVELVAPVGLGLMVFRGLRRDLFPMVGLLTILPVGALILSGSRGGIVCFAFEVGVMVLLARTRRGPEGPTMIAIAFVALAAFALVAWLGAGKAIERFSRTRVGDVTNSRRASMFRAGEHIFFSHPVQGTGLGAIVSVFPQYDAGYDGLVVDHVHNDYIEALAETGLLGGLCGIAFLWLLYRDARKSFTAEQGHFSRAMHAGAIAAVCGL
ncbi:MAG: O-antigen ligase family protein, partial [Candidatus Sulfotelmatobacter sp.]